MSDEDTHSPTTPPPPEPPPITVPTGGAISLKPAEFFPDAELFKGSTVHPNTSQSIIVTTEDKLRNYLHDHLQAANTRREWIAPIGLAFTIGTALLTTTFSDRFGMPAAFWQALFALALLVSLVWLIVAAVRLVVFWNAAKLDALIKKIKKLE